MLKNHTSPIHYCILTKYLDVSEQALNLWKVNKSIKWFCKPMHINHIFTSDNRRKKAKVTLKFMCAQPHTLNRRLHKNTRLFPLKYLVVTSGSFVCCCKRSHSRNLCSTCRLYWCAYSFWRWSENWRHWGCRASFKVVHHTLKKRIEVT